MDTPEQWKLPAAYELYTGTVLKLPDLVFISGELKKDKNEIWAKKLDQYRVTYMKMLTGKRRRVDRPDGGGPGVEAQAGMQAGVTEVQEPSPWACPSNKCRALGQRGSRINPHERGAQWIVCPNGGKCYWPSSGLALVGRRTVGPVQG